jgi:hypothetical protein
MDDPIKIIFKFKNNNRRIQHHVYVFIGDVSSKILSILNNIKDKTFYDSLLSLDKSDYAKLEKTYGNFWYKKFFNTYHINHSVNLIRNSKSQQKELISKHGKNWFNDHIEEHKLIEKQAFYNYSTIIRDDILRKEMRKKKTPLQIEEVEIDYTTHGKRSIVSSYLGRIDDLKQVNNDNEELLDSESELSLNSEEMGYLMDGGDIPLSIRDADDIVHQIQNNILMTNNSANQHIHDSMIGGKIISGSILDGEVIGDVNSKAELFNMVNVEPDAGKEGDKDGNKVIKFEEGMDNDTSLKEEGESLEFEDMEKIYQDMDVNIDNNVKKTNKLIKAALKDDKLFTKKALKLIEFDQSKDDLMYDEQLKDVYVKHYITNQYIFKDDTIKMIKNKICTSIMNNSKFDKTSYISPSRQYLWSEYFFDGKLEKIMVGQKWIRRTDLLKIDVITNTNIRFYEELRGKLKILKENIKRYGSKIKREDDDFNILYDYENYFLNNEIYMIDVYNELGKNYNPDPEALRNVSDVYIRIYFPRIKQEDVKYIIEYLNGNTKVESNKISSIYEMINNDLLLENQIMKTAEDVKQIKEHEELFKDNYITQSVIHVNLRQLNRVKLDLFRIFDKFLVTDKYPFIQYQTMDGQIIFKFSEKDIMEYSSKKENVDVLSKWFENAPYGISFKVKINEKNTEKFMAINLNESGRIEYKTQWKEDDMATITDIRKTYNYVKELIEKINVEKNNAQFDIPHNMEFKYAFINTIQRFVLPEKFIINHNDLSEFSRYFYPYVALVIEPRKRQSKIKKDDEKSKFGTYLRYKRVSKYENQARIEQRILYFMRNYDYNDKSLANEISKQFNITIDRAMEEIDRVRRKYPNIKKSRKILKKLENIPKYKPPGIGIDIQGKQRDKYKIRISGARNKTQLDRIISFMNILIYLYTETYLYKKPERQVLKDKLEKLTNIAKRRNRVDEIVNYDKESKTVKQMTQLDKKRIGFKPEKGQNQWTRSCQNSGNDKRRRPQLYLSADDLKRVGFKLDNVTGIYEKETIDITSKKKNKKIIIRAVELKNTDEQGNDSEIIYYSCNPEQNGKHMYIGFLSRSNNPFGQCMPCCFKKDPVVSKNKEKRDYFMKCIGKIQKTEKKVTKIVGDRLYILQDTNKIQESRFGFLPKYLDFYFNRSRGKERKIKHHYLVSTKTGYYFKFGTRQDDYPFLNAVASLVDMSVSDMLEKITKKLKNDKSNILFTALNNGDLKTQFGNREKYIKFINTNKILDFDFVNHIISIPGILKSNGLNIVVFKKQTMIIRESLQKERIRDDFVIICQNPEEADNLVDPNKETLFIIKENKNFYPIVKVTKKDENARNVKIDKKFKYEKNDENIIHHLLDFYGRNCQNDLLSNIKVKKMLLSAKKTNKILLSLNDPAYHLKQQIIDARNKCKYVITRESIIIPVRPSGSIYNIMILKNIGGKIMDLNTTIKRMKELYKKSDKKLPINPIGVYFDTRTALKAKIVGVMTNTYDVVPVSEEMISIDWINKNGLVMENKHMYDRIDEEIEKGRDNIVVDERIKEVNKKAFYNETYQLFRLELSDYINKLENESLKKKFIKIIADKKITKSDRKKGVRKLLYRIVDKNLMKIYENKKTQKGGQGGGVYDKFIHIVSTLPKLNDYIINNNREVCDIHKSKDKCSMSKHCHWTYDNCYLNLTKEMAISFVNKISEELIRNDLKAMELLRKDDYFVSDIVDYNRYTERDGQKIVKSTNYAINKVLGELFGADNIPKIGKRRSIKTEEINFQQMNMDNALQDMGDFMLQHVMENNLSMLRAYSNGYFWDKQKYYDLESRNLGYYSDLQTNLANYFRSLVIDWLTDKKNADEINKIKKYFELKTTKDHIRDFINKMTRDVVNSTNGVIEYYALNKIHKIPIIVLNDNNEIKYIIDDGIKFDRQVDKKDKLKSKELEKYLDRKEMDNNISIRFSLIGNSTIPLSVDAIYYK